MLTAIAVALGLLILWLLVAAYVMARHGSSLHQALLYAPLKVFFRVKDGAMTRGSAAEPPVIYAVWHQSRLEPALMLALLPSDTLHILDEDSARALWLDPYRALARTIVFNTHHVFVSRRLVRRLKGKGRLAVYLPDDESPDPKAFRLFRAIARIAANAGARVVPVHVQGARDTPFSLAPKSTKRRLMPQLTISTLEPMTIAEMVALADSGKPMGANAFFDRMLAVRRQASQESPTPDTA